MSASADPASVEWPVMLDAALNARNNQFVCICFVILGTICLDSSQSYLGIGVI